MPDKTHSNETVWTKVNIAPRGKSWLHGKLIDGIHGYKTRQGMENAEHAAHTGAPQHPDDAAVDALAALMKAKLAKQREKGYGGWDTDCTRERLSELLRDHVDKGDPVDVANFCAFLFSRGESIAPPMQAGMRNADGMYYLQDARWSAMVGNCPSFWRLGGGYTTSLDDAERFTLEAAMKQHKCRETDLPWLCSELDTLRRPTIDCQYMPRSWDDQRAAITAQAAQQGGDKQ